MIQKAWKFSVFYQMWFSRLPKFETYEAAYEDLETKFFAKFGRRRFKNYNSFKVVKSRYLNTK